MVPGYQMASTDSFAWRSLETDVLVNPAETARLHHHTWRQQNAVDADRTPNRLRDRRS